MVECEALGPLGWTFVSLGVWILYKELVFFMGDGWLGGSWSASFPLPPFLPLVSVSLLSDG